MEINKPTFKKICFMHLQQLTNFPYIEKDFDALTDYELLCKVVQYLNKVIASENQQNETMLELYNAFVELKDFVDNYFDNLDVQDEINNKLDAMAEDGTLENIIKKYLDKLENVQFIAPKNWLNTLSSDINLIKHGNKNILIDTSSESNWSNVQEFLSDNDVSHIDYFILTHYHGDHSGNIENLITNNYITPDTHLYFPAEVTKWTSIPTDVQNMKDLCEQNNLTYYVPYENEEVIINDLKITFYNCNGLIDDLYYYDNGDRDYNMTSTVCLFEHRNVKALYMGDGDKLTYQRMRENNFSNSKINLLKIGHHGINVYTDNQYLLNIKPDFAIQNAGILDFIKNNFGVCNQTSLLKEMDCTIYPTCFQNENIKLISDGSSIKVESGIHAEISNGLITLDLYVDKNASINKVQDGTQNAPFTDIMQAIGIIYKYPNFSYQIHVADGEYNDLHGEEPFKNCLRINTGLSTKITITGNTSNNNAVILHDAYIINSDVTFNNLTISGVNQNALYLIGSKILLNNVNIDNTGTGSGIIARNLTTLQLDNVNIYNANEGIITSDSYIFIASLTFHETLSTYINQGNSNVINQSINSIVFPSDAEKYKYRNWHTLKSDSLIIFNGSSNSIDLGYNISNFAWVQIEYQETDAPYIKNSTGKIFYPGQNTDISAMIAHPSGSNNYSKYGVIHFSTNTHVEITNQQQLTVYNGALSVEVKNGINITKIEVGFQDFQYLN